MGRRSALIICSLIFFPSFGQQATLEGVVSDADSKEPMYGVNVLHAPGSGVATDLEGRYSLQLPAGDHSIQFRSLGYETKEVKVSLAVGTNTTLDVLLEPSPTQLGTVVVSAGKFEQTIGEVTMSLDVLEPTLFHNKNITTMADALDQVPGVVVVDNDPQIRSGSGYSFGAGSRVMILVDDLPILSGDIGRPSWSFLPIENLEQVEVIKGASSVLYGSAALSGVVNVRTAYPRSEPTTRVSVFSGLYGSPRNEDARWWDRNAPVFGGTEFFHSRKFGQFDLVIGGNVFSDQGYIGPELIPADSIAVDPLRLGPGGYEHRYRMNVGTRWRSKKVTGLSYGVNANAMQNRSSTILIWNDIGAGLYRPSPATVTRTNSTQAYVDPYIMLHGQGGTRQSLKARYYYLDNQNDNDQTNTSEFLYGEYQWQRPFAGLDGLRLTAGLVGQVTGSRAPLFVGNEGRTGNNSASNLAGYLQADHKLLKKRLAVSAGARYERYRVNEDEQGQPVFRAGATYQLFEGTFFRTSYGQGFRFPTIGERYITTSVGQLNIYPSADLRPEKSWNFEMGIKQGFKIGGFSGYLDVVGFQQEFDQYIEFTFGQWGDPNDLQNFLGLGFRSVNTGGARVTGAEVEIAGKGTIGKVDLTLLAGYTRTKPITTSPDLIYAQPTFSNSVYPGSTYANTSYSTEGDVLKYRLTDLVRADLQAEVGRSFTGASIRYNSHVRNIDKIFVLLDEDGFLETGVSEWMRTHRSGDLIVDARMGRHLTEQVSLALLCNNLFNVEYSIRPLTVEAPRSFILRLTAEL